MKYSVNTGRISSVVKIVNFVRQARAKDPICLMAVIWISEIVNYRYPKGIAASSEA